MERGPAGRARAMWRASGIAVAGLVAAMGREDLPGVRREVQALVAVFPDVQQLGEDGIVAVLQEERVLADLSLAQQLFEADAARREGTSHHNVRCGLNRPGRMPGLAPRA